MSPGSSASWDSGNESAARLKMNNSHAERGAGFLLEPCSFSLQPVITNALNYKCLNGGKTSRGASGEAKVKCFFLLRVRYYSDLHSWLFRPLITNCTVLFLEITAEKKIS